jgi:hypothetical protein
MSNWNQNLAQSTDGHLCTLWRLSDNAQIVLHPVDLREWLDRTGGPGVVYSETLPAGQVPGPLSGVKAIYVGNRTSFRSAWDSRR